MRKIQKRGKDRYMQMVCPECREEIDVEVHAYRRTDKKTELKVDQIWACPKCGMMFQFMFIE